MCVPRHVGGRRRGCALGVICRARARRGVAGRDRFIEAGSCKSIQTREPPKIARLLSSQVRLYWLKCSAAARGAPTAPSTARSLHADGELRATTRAALAAECAAKSRFWCTAQQKVRLWIAFLTQQKATTAKPPPLSYLVYQPGCMNPCLFCLLTVFPSSTDRPGRRPFQKKVCLRSPVR